MVLKHKCLALFSVREIIAIGEWVADYSPDAHHVDIAFDDKKISIYNTDGTLVAERDFDYFM